MRSLIFGWAFAADPVVLDGVEAEAGLGRVSWATGQPVEALAAIERSDLLGEPIVSGGEVRWCPQAEPDRPDLGYLLDRVDAAIGWADWPRAAEVLSHTDALLACAGTVFGAELARYHALRGVVAAGEGRTDEAVAAFAQARAAMPDLGWDEAWPVGREQFDAPAGPSGVARGYGAVVLDGFPLQPSGRPVLAGVHPVSVGGRAGALTTTGAEVQVLDPGVLAERAFTDPEARLSASGAFAARFGVGAPVVVVSPRAVWSASAGDPQWTEIERRRASPLVPAGLGLVGVGVLSAVVGGVPTWLAWSEARSASAEMDGATGPAGFVDASGRYDEAAGQLRVVRWVPMAGSAVVGVGGVLLSVGLAVGPRSVRP